MKSCALSFLIHMNQQGGRGGEDENETATLLCVSLNCTEIFFFTLPHGRASFLFTKSIASFGCIHQISSLHFALMRFTTLQQQQQQIYNIE